MAGGGLATPKKKAAALIKAGRQAGKGSSKAVKAQFTKLAKANTSKKKK